jgi:hypothetical protein
MHFRLSRTFRARVNFKRPPRAIALGCVRYRTFAARQRAAAPARGV